MATAIKTQAEALAEWLPEPAQRLISDIFEASQIADDFVDGGLALEAKNAAMHRLLMLLVVQIPTNEFYAKFQGWLAPLLSASITQWAATNEWALDDGDVFTFAWAMRDITEIIIAQCALLHGGSEFALKVAIEAGRHFRTNEDAESVSEWRMSLER